MKRRLIIIWAWIRAYAICLCCPFSGFRICSVRRWRGPKSKWPWGRLDYLGVLREDCEIVLYRDPNAEPLPGEIR